MNSKSLICLSLLAVGCAAPMWAQDAPAAEEITAPKPGEPHYLPNLLRSYYFRSNPGVVVRVEGVTGEVLYADPSLDIPVGATVLLEEPDDAACGGSTSVLGGRNWLVLQGPVKPLKEGVYHCMLDNLDCVEGSVLAAYGLPDMPENWRKVRDIICQDMALSVGTTKLADNEAGEISVDYDGDGYVYKYDGVKYSSAGELAKHLEKRGTYRLSFQNLVTDEMMLEQVTAMESAGISINSVERGYNSIQRRNVISVRKLKERAK